MKGVYIILLIGFLFGLGMILLGAINPSVMDTCEEGETLPCYDENYNRIKGVSCVCENWSGGSTILFLFGGVLVTLDVVLFVTDWRLDFI